MTPQARPGRRPLVGRMLHSTPARGLRQWLRDTEWRLRGLGMRNPPRPAPLRSILFICKGNICRSPFAALLAARIAGQLPAPGIRFASAGLSASRDAACPVEAIREAAAWDVLLDGHRPTTLTDDLIAAHDLLVVMEPWHRQAVVSRWPAAREKVWLLPLLDPEPCGAYDRYHLADPFGKADAFQGCYRRIDRTVRELLKQLGAAD